MPSSTSTIHLSDPVQRKETDARLPGWTLLKAPGKGLRYRSPSGDEVGYYAYSTALKHYERTGVVPQEPLGSKWKTYSRDTQSVFSRKTHEPSEMATEIPVPGTEDSVLIDLPEPKLTPASKTKSGLFSSRQLAEGFQSILIIFTALLAVASQLPEAQMTEVETKAISIPLGNIIERSKWNTVVGSVIVDKSDWIMLGYALYTYVDRVATAARVRRQYAKSTGTFTQAPQQPGYGPVNGNAGTGGISLRPTPQGLRGYQIDGQQ